MPPPFFTTAQAAAQLTRDGDSWSAANGTPVTVSYAFRATAPAVIWDDVAGFTQFNAAQIVAAQHALQFWSEVANITFVRVGSGTQGSGAYSDNAAILFANYTVGGEDMSGFAWGPDTANTAAVSVEGDIWINGTYSENLAPQIGNFGMYVLVHEIGHAIGLDHPSDYGADPTYDVDADYYQDSLQYSLLSYFSETETGADYHGEYPAAPLLHDIAAAQLLYGANMTTRTGDTVYGFNSNTGRPHMTLTGAADTCVFAVWDAGGIDTLDFSGYGQRASIDLHDDVFSSVGGYSYNVAICPGVVIENAKGGGGDDFIVGNEAANVIHGNGGDDGIYGLAGADTLFGGAGDDVFYLTSHDAATDHIYGGAAGADAGYDELSCGGWNVGVTVQLSGYAIAAGAVIALFSGIEAASGTLHDDALIGDGADNRLTGLRGSDWLVGGGGDDVFIQSTFQQDPGSVDTIFGDAGFDTIDYSQDGYAYGPTGVNVHLSGWASIGGALVAHLSGVEAAIGTSFDDALIGDAGANRLAGGAGADWLVGGGGDDAFVQGLETSVDRFFGDAGTDTVDYSAASGGVVIQLSGYATINGGALLSTFSSIENAIGTGFADVIVGNASNNRLAGGAGADWIVGGAGDDVFAQDVQSGVDRLFGDAGADTLDYSAAAAGIIVQLSGYATTGAAALLATFTGIENAIGASFDDALIGNASANNLTGGRGADWLVGGAGADRFIYQASDEGGDTIADFSRTQLDRIDLSAIDANPFQAGNQIFQFATSRTSNLPGQAVATAHGDSTTISLYLDADDTPDMAIHVLHQSGVVMNASDFIL